MYNLLVSGEENAWEGKMYSLTKERCVKVAEYTPIAISERLGKFTLDAKKELMSYPCIFAYEGFHEAPKLGWLTSIREKSNTITIEFRIEELSPWVTVDQFRELAPILDIVGFESFRTHWAVKDVELIEELKPYGVILPKAFAGKKFNVRNPEKIDFDVAFSFPGESRPYVEEVLKKLKELLPYSPIFYDKDYQAFLARPQLDIYLGNIYKNKSKLLAVFLSKDYQNKSWCGLEWRVIREVIF
ncbi:hypothetical protein [Cyclobacterium qasimii]|nr:hypothetical protein [Cyclobacterium qasimii]EPR65647.1 hypothetical protein ADICYQ_5354 [Cyclobacterium qasimii M12-11B]